MEMQNSVIGPSAKSPKIDFFSNDLFESKYTFQDFAGYANIKKVFTNQN